MNRRVLVPTLASLGLHALLLALAGTVTLGILHAGERPRGEVVVELSFSPSEGRDTAYESRAAEVGAAGGFAAPVVAVIEAPAPVRLEAPVIAPAPARPAARPTVAETRLQRPAAAGRASFAGVRADQVRDVVYVVDVSGSMASSLAFVVEELKQSLTRLDERQRFAIVAFADRRSIMSEPATTWLFGSGLTPASPANIGRAAKWLDDLRPMGRSDPLPALESAIALQPDVIFLLTRSIARTEQATWGAGVETILERLDGLNPRIGGGRRRSLIKTVQFIDDDPTGLLQRIAMEHAGGPGGYALRTLEHMGVVAAGPEPSLRLDAEVDRAAALLGELLEAGADTSVLIGLADETLTAEVLQTASRAMALLSGAARASDPFAQLLLARSAIAVAACEPSGNGRERLVTIASEALARIAPNDDVLGWSAALETARLSLVVDQNRLPQRLQAPPATVEWRLKFEGALVQIALSNAEMLETDLAAARSLLFDRPDENHRRGLLARAAAARARALAETLDGDARNRLWRLAARLLLEAADELSASDEAGDRLALAESLWWEGLGGDPPLEILPPEVSLAYARAWVTRDVAIAERLARAVLVRDDAVHLAPYAMHTLAAALARDPLPQRRELAVLTLLDAAEMLGPAAGETFHHWQQAALHAAREGVLTTTQGRSRHEALVTYEGALRRVLSSDHVLHRAFWASEYPSVAFELAGLFGGARALDLLARIDPRAALTPEAVELYASIAEPVIGELTASYEAMQRAPGGREQALVAFEAAATRLELASGYFAARGATLHSLAARWSLGRLVRAEVPERGAVILREVFDAGWYTPGGREATALEVAEALAASGRRAEAFTLLRPIAEGRAGPRDEADREYWRSWALLLEILEQENGDGARTRMIQAHLLRLRGIDDEFGGEPTRARLRGVEQRIGIREQK